MTIEGALRSTAEQLGSLAEANLLLGQALGIDKAAIRAHSREEVPAEQLAALQTMVGRRIQGEPIAYILGWREFWGRRFEVNTHVLIPRHETEILVEQTLQRPDGPIRLLDFGAGSGAVAITLKLERPDWEVWASEIEPGALALAQANAKSLGAEIRWVAGGLPEGEQFHLIVSNPPYVGREEVLPDEVRLWEPDRALYAPEAGLSFYRMLAESRAAESMILEIGQTQADAVKRVFEANGWQSVRLTKDLDGNDRVWEFALTSGAAP